MPTPVALLDGVEGTRALLLPSGDHPGDGFVQVGEVTRVEVEDVMTGYSFDFATNQLSATYNNNPTAGRQHHFCAWRIARPEGLPDTPDVLIAGPPCQGFSLGGNRHAADDRNGLFREVCRVAQQVHPRVVIIENVLNLRTMLHPDTGRPFIMEIAVALTEAGYGDIAWDVFKMDRYGVPQTRRRFVFVAFRNGVPDRWHLPTPSGYESIRPWLWDLAHDDTISLPNHDPSWGFKSQVHVDRGVNPGQNEPMSVVRFSRTASDGNPIRDWDRSFPAVDTATVWGFAHGHASARREPRDRSGKAKFVRNPDTDVTLWRVYGDRLRSLTHREYARLQTFPDSWEFVGGNKRDVHIQIGNAVPVQFAKRLGQNIQEALRALDTGRAFPQSADTPLRLF